VHGKEELTPGKWLNSILFPWGNQLASTRIQQWFIKQDAFPSSGVSKYPLNAFPQ
jgi:hypothetical protein